MAKTTKEYLFEIIENEGYKYYTISDESGSKMRDQRNQNFSTQQVVADISRFLENNEGVFTISFRDTQADHRDESRKYHYTVDASPSRVPQPVNGFPMGSLGMDQWLAIIAQKDSMIEQLRNDLTATKLNGLNESQSLRMELMKQELTKKDDGDDQMIQQAIGALSGMFSGGGSNVGLSGIGEQVEMPKKQSDMNITEEQKSKINSAVLTLLQADPKFAERIVKLANLAKSMPQVYNNVASKLDLM